jgi:predicted transcriptional regulator
VEGLRKKTLKDENPKTTKQLGVKVNIDLWREFRMLAIKQDRTATELLKEAMEEYLERHSGNAA